MKTDYNAKALQFLADTKTTLKIEKAEKQKSPLWCKKGERHGINYICTLKNSKHKYTFDFWDSIHNAEIIEAIQNYCPIESQKYAKDFQFEKILKAENINTGFSIISRRKELVKQYEPKEYDILACLDPLYESNFEDFCFSFGYDIDSITAKETFDACMSQDHNLRRLFTDTELERLTEIN